MEKRKFARDTLNLAIQMRLDNKEITCNIKNMSDGGALAKIESVFNNFITEDDIGKNVSFTVGYRSLSMRTYNGRIIRLLEDDNEKFVAIYFY